MLITKTIKDLKPLLMAGVRGEVKEPYFIIENKEQVIYVVSPGRNGSEFNKTTGYFSTYPSMQAYQCLYGQGVFVMQRNDEFGEAKEFKVVRLTSGRQVLVPAGWGMCIVNSGNTFLTVLRNSLLSQKHKNSKPIIEKHGFAYYVVEKKGEIAFDQNPNYRVHPQITTE